ncbi:MAG: hypothetical protein AMK71_12785 [Nitrospira bacterium SG8_35_4]|nr:MAG: hypothetical protein AMK71_12785 [Nitrospira bacterium SG8_35_4]
MNFKITIRVLAAVATVALLSGGSIVFGDDLDDGISKYSDEGIAAETEMGKTDTNINFIVIESMAEAKMRQKAGDKNSNFNDGSGDNNQNSVVVGQGAQVDKVININVNK